MNGSTAESSTGDLDPQLVELLGGIDFDPEALHRRYLAERDKRVRGDGNDQYVQVTAQFSHYAEDPYAEPLSREPVFDDVDMTVIGGGFGGLLMGARLREQGFEDIRMVDAAGDFGGTWYWNRYPGAMCDVESYCYLPLLEELNYIPRHRYSYGPEIFEHSRAIARHYRLYDKALLQTTVTGLRWDEEQAVWIVTTNRGDAYRSRFVAMANGPLNRPKLPGIPGINAFTAHTFHTSRWDYRYTGGDSGGNLERLRDKRVGIIGTGATALQCVPHLAQTARQLHIFQRTPSSVDYRRNEETDPAWAASLTPGWQKRRIDNFTALLAGEEQEQDLIQDGWTAIFRSLTATATREAEKTLGRRLTRRERGLMLELADYKQMNEIRGRIDAIVRDPETAEALKPWYRQFCKRPGFHDQYIESFNRPNVKLVDTAGKGVERLEGNDVIVDGKAYAVDCLIFATGFEVGTAYTRRAGYDIVGRRGVKLSDYWSGGLRTFHGLMAHQFPNCFFLGFTQTGVTINAPHTLDQQARHVAYLVRTLADRGLSVIEPTAEAEQAYVEEIRGLAGLNARFYDECTPGYYNGEGEEGHRASFFFEMYGLGPVRFFEMLDAWRAEGTLKGMAVA